MISSADAFAALDQLASVPHAFTTGTAANQALVSYAAAIAAPLKGIEAAAGAAIAAADMTTPAGLLSAVTAAGNAACAHAALVEVTNLRTVLGRP